MCSGTPTAPTLTIGTETGITHDTLHATSGSTRSWTYTISKGGSGTSDSGAVSVVERQLPGWHQGRRWQSGYWCAGVR